MKRFLAIIALCTAAPGSAGVVFLTPNTFISHHVVELDTSPDQAFRRFGHIGRWWNPEHSYSGKRSNLTLDLEAGGCFCEKLPKGGSAEHMRVSLVQPGNRLVLNGGLGPLMFQGIAGTMDILFEKTGGGNTLVTLDYRVAGFAYSNAEKNAPLVDKVLAEQMQRYKAYASKP